MATTAQPVPTPTDAEMESDAPMEMPAEDDGSYTIEIKVDASGGIQVGDVNAALEELISSGYAGSPVAAISQAIMDAHKKITKKCK